MGKKLLNYPSNAVDVNTVASQGSIVSSEALLVDVSMMKNLPDILGETDQWIAGDVTSVRAFGYLSWDTTTDNTTNDHLEFDLQGARPVSLYLLGT